MKADNIMIVGVKNSVLAFSRDTGEHLWATQLKGGADSFVSLVSDDKRVYAHSGGELHCLDLFTGVIIWRDKLKGFGYGLASLALPGGPFSTVEAVHRNLVQQSEGNTTSQGIST
jgi:outer membrane protein assembly factor BamB